MVDLSRFPVSDEIFPDRKTFCVILDRNKIFEIPNYVFFRIGHVTLEDMEMSAIALRIESKQCFFFRLQAKLFRFRGQNFNKNH